MKKLTLASALLVITCCRAYVGSTNIGSYAQMYPQAAGLDEFEAFLKVYQNRPVNNNTGGLRSVGLFSLWYLLRCCQPDVVIESGVWRGQSTWLIEQAVPNAELICIDPKLSARLYISKRAQYFTQDFSQLNFANLKNKKVVCFFDDHQNAYLRVLQAHACGFKYLIFDDNYPAPFGMRAPFGHLTLRHCFDVGTFLDKAQQLKALIKNYYLMPQIFLLPAVVEVGQCRINATFAERTILDVPAYWRDLNDVDEKLRSNMKVFCDDAATYRWMTYVELP